MNPKKRSYMAGKAKKKAAAKPKAVKTAVSVNIQSDAVQSIGKLPRGTVTLSTTGGVKINVQKLSRTLMRDQRARMVSSMGCVSNPGGPGC